MRVWLLVYNKCNNGLNLLPNPTKWLMCCVINITGWNDNTWISLFNKLIQYLDPIFVKNSNLKFIKYWLALVEVILINKKIPSICLISYTMPYKHLPGISSVRYKQKGYNQYSRLLSTFHAKLPLPKLSKCQ